MTQFSLISIIEALKSLRIDSRFKVESNFSQVTVSRIHRIIVIFEEIPDNTKIYIFDNLKENEDLVRFLLSLQGSYINTNSQEEPIELFSEKVEHWAEIGLCSKYISSEITKDTLIISQDLFSIDPKDTAVVLCGFIL